MIKRALTSAEQDAACRVARESSHLPPVWRSSTMAFAVGFLISLALAQAAIRWCLGTLFPIIMRHQFAATLVVALGVGAIAAVLTFRSETRASRAVRRMASSILQEATAGAVHEYVSHAATSSWDGSEEHPGLVVRFGEGDTLWISAADLEEHGVDDLLSGFCRVVVLPESGVVLEIDHGA